MLNNIIAKVMIKRFCKEERGVTLLEYALLGGLISIVAVASITAIGVDVGTIFSNIETGADTAATNSAG